MALTELLKLDVQGDIAVVTITHPPVNALSHAVRAGLMAALAQTEADASIAAVVLVGMGAMFSAGADVTEFAAAPQAPLLPEVVLGIEASTKPWIAALHGNVLGGGLELALGCHYRIALPGTKLGLPEVTLGLIPGAGGTVRLPRLIGPVAALAVIAGGKPVLAENARNTGLIDAIVADLQGDALGFAASVRDKPLPVPIIQRPAETPDDWADQCARVIAGARGQQAPLAAVQSVNNALTLPPDQALRAERALFTTLKDGPQSAALRHLFFAERKAGTLPMVKGIAPGPLDQIGVIGGGTMGAGIAAACLLAGLKVTLVEQNAAGLELGRGRVLAVLDNSLTRGLVSAPARRAMEQALTLSVDYASLAPADLVIEAVFEDMAVKHDVFRSLDAVTRADTVLASNTSYLDIGQIAQVVRNPARVIGLHFFSPAHIMKLLELVIPVGASPQAVSTGLALGRKLRKITVPAGVCDGFIGNRIMSAYRLACDQMLAEGALPWDIDAAMRDFGFPMGLYEMQDLAGLDIAWAMRKRQGVKSVTIADHLCELGRFGRKSGRGWYLYDTGKPVPDPDVAQMIMATRGTKRRDVPVQSVMSTILLSMQTTGQALLSEGIARSGADIDVVMVNGYGFPRWRGGPMFMQQGGSSVSIALSSGAPGDMSV